MNGDERAVHVEHGYERALVGRLQRHEEDIRRMARERAARRLQPLLPSLTDVASGDFSGCVE